MDGALTFMSIKLLGRWLGIYSVYSLYSIIISEDVILLSFFGIQI